MVGIERRTPAAAPANATDPAANPQAIYGPVAPRKRHRTQVRKFPEAKARFDIERNRTAVTLCSRGLLERFGAGN